LDELDGVDGKLSLSELVVELRRAIISGADRFPGLFARIFGVLPGDFSPLDSRSLTSVTESRKSLIHSVIKLGVSKIKNQACTPSSTSHVVKASFRSRKFLALFDFLMGLRIVFSLLRVLISKTHLNP
jgi:hypothetical protein